MANSTPHCPPEGVAPIEIIPADCLDQLPNSFNINALCIH